MTRPASTSTSSLTASPLSIVRPPITRAEMPLSLSLHFSRCLSLISLPSPDLDPWQGGASSGKSGGSAVGPGFPWNGGAGDPYGLPEARLQWRRAARLWGCGSMSVWRMYPPITAASPRRGAWIRASGRQNPPRARPRRLSRVKALDHLSTPRLLGRFRQILLHPSRSPFSLSHCLLKHDLFFYLCSCVMLEGR